MALIAFPERRRRRSRFRRRALRYLVEHRCREHNLSLLAVADENGRVLAASCAQPDPSEIAAVAPILDPTGSGRSARMFGREVWIQRMDGPGGALFCYAMGESGCTRTCVAELFSSVCRILGR